MCTFTAENPDRDRKPKHVTSTVNLFSEDSDEATLVTERGGLSHVPCRLIKMSNVYTCRL